MCYEYRPLSLHPMPIDHTAQMYSSINSINVISITENVHYNRHLSYHISNDLKYVQMPYISVIMKDTMTYK